MKTIIPFRGPPIRDFAAHPGLIMALGPVGRAAGNVTLQLRPNGVEVTCGDPNVLLAFIGLLADAQDEAPEGSPLLLLARLDVAES